MSTKEVYIPKYKRLPSLVGKDIVELEKYAKLPRVETYKKIQSFLNVARNTREVNVLFIKSEWGEGKSSIYEGFLRVPEVIESDVVLRIDTSRLITILREDHIKFHDTKSPGIRLFAMLIYAIRDLINSSTVDVDSRLRNTRLPDKKENQNTIDFIRISLGRLFDKLPLKARLFIFLDEFEDIVDQDRSIQEAVIAGLVDIINGQPDIICGQGAYAGRVHLIIAITPPAYEILVSKVSTFSNLGRLFGQRVRVIELEKITREDAYRFVIGCLRYCWEGELPSLPFTESGMLNAIYLITLGNPRGMIELIRRLLSTAETLSKKENMIKVITPHDFISCLSGEKMTIHGGEIEILERDIVDKVIEEVQREAHRQNLDPKLARSLLEILVSSPIPLSMSYIMSRLNLEDVGLFHNYLDIIRLSLNRVRNVRQPFLRFKKVRITRQVDEASRQELKVMKALTFYSLNDVDFELEPEMFIPSDNLRELSMFNPEAFRQYIDYFASSLEETVDEDNIITEIDTFLRNEVEVFKEDYYMLSPAALNMFYTPPSMFFLDFIKNVEDRFNIGMEVLRRTSEYEHEFCKGVYYLISDGCPDLKIQHKIESNGPITLDVYAFSLKYPESLFRAYIYSKLNWGERSDIDIQEKIDLLKQFHIPLLIVFTWNFIPDEIRATLQMHSTSERLISHMCFVLKTRHLYQIIARALAEERGCQIVESRWKVRASQILDELKFKDTLIEWIEKGKDEGYTLTPLYFAGKSEDKIIKAFRTLLVTDGTCEERYELLRNFDERFRIFGKEFPLNPLDISSARALSEYAQILSDNGFLEISEEGILIKLTNVEKRILQILHYHPNGLSEDDLKKMFVTLGKASLSPYINVLEERRMIVKDRTGTLRIYRFDHLEHEFERLQQKISEKKRYYQEIGFGYLVSIKQRDLSFIKVQEYIRTLENLISNLKHLKYASHDIWRRKFILFEILSRHFLDTIDPMLRTFIRRFQEKRNRVPSIERLKRIIEDLKMHFSTLLRIPVERISFREELILLELEREIVELNRKESFDREDISKLLSSLSSKLIQKREEGLIDSLKGECYVFDIKIVMLDECYEKLQNIASKISENRDKIYDKLSVIRELFQQVRGHELFRKEFSQYQTLLSDKILKAYRSLYEVKYPQLLGAQPLVVEENLMEINMSNLIEALERFRNELLGLKRFLDHTCELIMQFHQLETELISSIDRLSKIINMLEKFYEGYEEMSHRLSLEKEKYLQIIHAYHSFLGKVESLTKETEDTELVNICKNGIELFKRNVNELNTIMDIILNHFENSKNIFNERAEMIGRLLKVFDKSINISESMEELAKYLSIFENRFRDICNIFPNNLNEVNEERFVKGGFVEILNKLKNLGQEIRDLFLRYELLSEQDLIVLETLLASNVSKVNIATIIPDLIEKTSLDLRELGEIILKLASIGLISVEVSL